MKIYSKTGDMINIPFVYDIIVIRREAVIWIYY